MSDSQRGSSPWAPTAWASRWWALAAAGWIAVGVGLHFWGNIQQNDSGFVLLSSLVAIPCAVVLGFRGGVRAGLVAASYVAVVVGAAVVATGGPSRRAVVECAGSLDTPPIDPCHATLVDQAEAGVLPAVGLMLFVLCGVALEWLALPDEEA